MKYGCACYIFSVLLALLIITGLMASGDIDGYHGGAWMWAVFAVSFLGATLTIGIVNMVISGLMALGAIPGYQGEWMWAVFGLVVLMWVCGRVYKFIEEVERRAEERRRRMRQPWYRYRF